MSWQPLVRGSTQLPSLSATDWPRAPRPKTPTPPPIEWTPQPGPQSLAFSVDADQIGYGGAAGGGKTDLALGLAGLKHRRSIIFRRTFPNARGIIERSKEIYTGSFNESLHVWRLGNRTIEIGALQYEDDKKNHQGQARDLHVFDEATEFSESQVRFVIGWNRTASKHVRPQVLLTFNPPMDEAGAWVIRFFAPWLQEGYPDPAESGEVRYVAMVDGKEQFYRTKADVPAGHASKSRVFIRASLADNPILAATGYGDTIELLPEPLRSILKGNFGAGKIVNPWQVIPTAWVEQAMARWVPDPPAPLAALGVDVARGGSDETAIARRHGANWIGAVAVYPGRATPDGPSVSALVIAEDPGEQPINVDVIGVGGSVYDDLRGMGYRAFALNASEGSNATDRSGKLPFANKRAEWWWGMREALDPKHGVGLALPPDDTLKAELTAPTWRLQGKRILIESKDDLRERLGRSTNRADAVLLAMQESLEDWLIWGTE